MQGGAAEEMQGNSLFVRMKQVRLTCIFTVGKSQSCMVSALPASRGRGGGGGGGEAARARARGMGGSVRRAGQRVLPSRHERRYAVGTPQLLVGGIE